MEREQDSGFLLFTASCFPLIPPRASSKFQEIELQARLPRTIQAGEGKAGSEVPDSERAQQL